MTRWQQSNRSLNIELKTVEFKKRTRRAGGWWWEAAAGYGLPVGTGGGECSLINLKLGVLAPRCHSSFSSSTSKISVAFGGMTPGWPVAP